MVTAPVIVLLYDRVFVAGSFRIALGARRWLYVGLASSWIVLIALNMSGPRFRSAGFSSGIAPWTYFLNQLVLITRYLRLAVWPRGFVVDYGVPRSLHLSDVWLSGVVLILLVAATLVAWWRQPKIGFLGLWFFITLAPTSSLVPIATEVGAERRMYLPMCALVTLIVWGARHLLADAPHYFFSKRAASQALSVGVVAVAVALMFLTVQRNAEYRASRSVLWQTVLDRYPHARAHYNLGVVLREEGRRDDALREYQTAAAEMPDAEYALGFELLQDKKYPEAIERLRRYIQLRPEDANVVRAYNLLGLSLAATGALDAAMSVFRRVLQMQPRNVDALAGLADALLGRGQLDEAIATYQQYVRLAPPNAGAYFNLGLALGRQRRDDEAVAMFTRAVDLNPQEPAYRANLASGLLASGRMSEAVEQYRRAAELEHDPDARAELTGIIQQLTARPQGAR